jgi:hypothetical protein
MFGDRCLDCALRPDEVGTVANEVRSFVLNWLAEIASSRIANARDFSEGEDQRKSLVPVIPNDEKRFAAATTS